MEIGKFTKNESTNDSVTIQRIGYSPNNVIK